MGWSIGFDRHWNRDIGYGVPAYCDHPRCTEVIDRGLSFVCAGEQPNGGDGCGLYFCSRHQTWTKKLGQCCGRCAKERPPYAAKPDHPEWIQHKLTDESWAEWRAEHPDEVASMRSSLSVVSLERQG